MIRLAPPDFLRAISLLSWNVTQQTVPLKPSVEKDLTPYAKHIVRLSRKSLSSKERRKTLLQRGGFLPLILKLVGGLLPTIVGAALK